MAKGIKTGGRTAGTPNKATSQFKDFLDDVFTAALNDAGFKTELLLQITTLKLDSKVLLTLLAYWAGSVPKAVDHKHSGKLTLEQLVAGVSVDEDEDDEDDPPVGPAADLLGLDHK